MAVGDLIGGEQPAGLAETRIALHRLAAYVIAPVRHTVTGRFGLRATPGGFGTPPFGDDDRRVRVSGRELIDETATGVRSTEITSLDAAAEFLGSAVDPETAAEHDSPPVGDSSADLGIDETASLFLGDWFGVAFEALERVRQDDESVDASIVQLWPGHFDPAIEVGDEAHRASYGASPGDHNIDEPYLYVALWSPDDAGIDPTDPVWNGEPFTGAMLKLGDFPDGSGPVDVALEFWRQTRDLLG